MENKNKNHNTHTHLINKRQPNKSTNDLLKIMIKQ